MLSEKQVNHHHPFPFHLLHWLLSQMNKQWQRPSKDINRRNMAKFHLHSIPDTQNFLKLKDCYTEFVKYWETAGENEAANSSFVLNKSAGRAHTQYPNFLKLESLRWIWALSWIISVKFLDRITIISVVRKTFTRNCKKYGYEKKEERERAHVGRVGANFVQ